MSEIIQKILEQIDSGLASCKRSQTTWNDTPLASEAIALGTSIILRLTSPSSSYYSSASAISKHAATFVATKEHRLTAVEKIAGLLQALRKEFEGGYLATISELMRAETLSDFAEQANHLLAEGYKDPAAVILGGILEQHIKKLCQKYDVDQTVQKDNGDVRQLKLDELNAALAKAEVYNKAYQKLITAFLAVRNAAAHGKWSEYSEEQVRQLSHGITNFIAMHPA